MSWGLLTCAGKWTEREHIGLAVAITGMIFMAASLIMVAIGIAIYWNYWLKPSTEYVSEIRSMQHELEGVLIFPGSHISTGGLPALAPALLTLTRQPLQDGAGFFAEHISHTLPRARRAFTAPCIGHAPR